MPKFVICVEISKNEVVRYLDLTLYSIFGKKKHPTFSTKEGGLSPGDGKMTFPDFYPGECSADGRLCSFLSREGTRIFREQGEGEAYFRGEFSFLSANTGHLRVWSSKK